MLSILLAIQVAIIWSLGDVNYSKISKKYDRNSIYLYTFLLRTIIYLGVVLIFDKSIIGTFNKETFIATIPVILCDLSATLVINLAMKNGKLSIINPIMASYPIVSIILGIFFLQEKVSIYENIIVGIIKSEKAPHPNLGILFSLLYMILVAFSIYFEKKNYISRLTIFDLYYYKGAIYFLVSLYFIIKLIIGHKKLKLINFSIIKGCGLTPIGNVLDSFALNMGDMSIITPISSLYAVFTNLISRFILKEKTSIKERICIGLIILSTLTLIIIRI